MAVECQMNMFAVTHRTGRGSSASLSTKARTSRHSSKSLWVVIDHTCPTFNTCLSAATVVQWVCMNNCISYCFFLMQIIIKALKTMLISTNLYMKEAFVSCAINSEGELWLYFVSSNSDTIYCSIRPRYNGTRLYYNSVRLLADYTTFKLQ